MKYDFTTWMERGGHDAIALEEIPVRGVKVKEGFSKIPMWVADMNFPTLPTILQSVEERLKHHHFGYFNLSESYFESIIRWQKDRYGVMNLSKEEIGYENGVLGCVASALQAFTAPGEAILIHSPIYGGFSGTVESLGRRIVLSPLKQDDDGIWRMDYEDMEKKLKDNRIHFAVFCSPHNPCGRVWEREELEKAMEIYQKYDCVVVSDEIWADLTMPGQKHIPTRCVSEDARNRTICVYAPSKTFNLAGLIGAYHVISNPALKDRVEKVSSSTRYNSCNVLSMHALIGAYKDEGREWVDELREVLNDNLSYACDFIRENFAGVKVSMPQGTYMLFLNCKEWLETCGKSLDELLYAGAQVGVIWLDGRDFRADYCIRMNLALPKAKVVEAFDRLKKYVFTS